MKFIAKILAHVVDGNTVDIGMHTTLLDANSILDPEVIALTESINPTLSRDYGAVWNLFKPRSTPFLTEEYEILSRNYTAPTFAYTASGGDGWDSTSDTTTLAITDVSRLQIGDVLLVGDEIVVVSAVNSTTSVDVYERGSGDTSGAQHGASGTGKVIGNANIEGTMSGRAHAEQTGLVTNYMQLVEEIVDLSKADTDQARKTGRTEVNLKEEAMRRVIRKLATSAIFGVARVGTASIPAMTRGLLSHLRDLTGGIKTAVSGAFTEAALQAILDDVHAAGGTVNAIVMSPANKRVANTFTGADSVTTTRDSRTGGVVLDGYLSDGFGVVPFVVDIDMPNDMVAVVNSNLLTKGWKVNDTLAFVPVTNVNPRENKQLLAGKFGLAVEGVGSSHGLLTGLTT